ncbi:MAG: DNA topology modulation protein [Acidobacteria bacterium]|nr:DNA topology modulation protein [Acidobacteriota bacterium]
MKKILVIGSGGAGKSTFAARLGERLGLPVVHLDRLYWNPGWVKTPEPEFRGRVADAIARDAWIMDGNYSGTLDVRLEACDTVVFLDVPRAVCVWRIVKRTVTYRNGRRPDMAEGCREKFNPEFMRWVWDYPERTRPKILKRLEEHARGKNIYILRTQSEIERFLARRA